MELYHHGIKGQKWGVRRYQNPDGSLTAAGRNRYPLTKATNGSEETSNEIYRTLSKSEKQLIMGMQSDETPPRTFIKKGEGKYLVKQVLVKYGDVPVAALDLWNQEQGTVAVSIMTRNDEKYRNKGFANEAVKEGIKAFEKCKDAKVLEWGVWEKNTPSRRLAEKNGFQLVDYRDPGGENFLIYQRRKN